MAHWWQDTPWRMVQTNLPERAMAEMDAERFARSLESFGATVVNLNAAGIIASYPTKLDFQPRSRYITGNSLLEMVDACHRHGIRVIARTDFSRIRRDVYEQHPGWAARLGDGSIVDYHGYVSVCPNSDYQNEAMFQVLEELFTTHPFDGLYCNMSSFFITDYDGKVHGVCQCERCRTLYQQATGRSLAPGLSLRDPAMGPYIAFLARCGAQHKAKLTSFLKKLNPELALDGVDFARSEVSLDYDRPNWVYKASSNARIAAGPGRTRPSDTASVGFLGFPHRYIAPPPGLMALRQWQSLANSGCVSLYLMGTLDAARDTAGLKATREVFRFHQQHAGILTGLHSLARTVILHSGSWKRMSAEEMGWVRILTESHIPFDELPLSELKDTSLLNGKTLVILPDAPRLSESQAGALDAFVLAGGTLLITGATAQGPGSAPLTCLGGAKVTETCQGLRSSMWEIPPEQADDFPSCRSTPWLDPGPELWKVQPGPDTQTWLHLVPESPLGPPEECWVGDAREEIPGLLRTFFGSGQSLWLPWKGAALCETLGTENPLRFLQDVLFELCGAVSVAPDLSPMVEVVLAAGQGRTVVQLINAGGCCGAAWRDPVPVHDITLKLPDMVFSSVHTLRGGQVDRRTTGKELLLTLDLLQDYEAIVFEQST
ncbi:hypothetical protein [Subdoligranulum variabile]|uniref:hypothetical protein n=1 Tax=Subdoligranulum variabile TaxID=214851 RepID=UPI002943C59B|nr:hypothetical protein [Subdoligranulum variabile]